jgi:triosephosphate isomerase (TIM)
MKPYVIVANWKMYLSHQEAITWAQAHFPQLASLLARSATSLILCPAYDALAAVSTIKQSTPILIGAQDCSAFASGAHTGQVSARSLKEIGCTYALVGHSEIGDDAETVSRKLAQLFGNAITPIICINEVTHLEPLLPTLVQHSSQPIGIAYEPLAAIGSSTIPSTGELAATFGTLRSILTNNGITQATLMYGGNVNENTLPAIQTVAEIQGVLVGRASTDFQKLKTIVSLVQKS